MSFFKMLLCGAGLLVFVWVKYFGASSDPLRPSDVRPTPFQPTGTTQEDDSNSLQVTEIKSVVTKLEFRNKLVTVKTGLSGPVYEVQDKAGKVLAVDLSEQELQAREPELYRLIQTAVVGTTAKDAGVLDARVSVSAPVNPAAPRSPGSR